MKNIIKKGTLLNIDHGRKGKFLAYAKRDFDLDEEFYPVILAVGKVRGMNTSWEAGEEIPCRKSLCKIINFKEIQL